MDDGNDIQRQQNNQPLVPLRVESPVRHPGHQAIKPFSKLFFKRLKKRAIKHSLITLGISIVALVFGILSLYASWKALDIARAAYSQDYWAYEAQKIANRLAVMQLCALNLTKYAETCAKVETWDYLPSVYDVVMPVWGNVSKNQPQMNLIVNAKVAATAFGATAGFVVLVTLGMLAFG